MPIRTSFSFVLIFPSKASQVKISIRGGTIPRHMPLIISWVGCCEIFANSKQRDLTENSLVLCGFQIIVSAFSGDMWTHLISEFMQQRSSRSRGLRVLFQVKHHTHSCPSQTPSAATDAIGLVASLNRRGNAAFSGLSQAHTSCQKSVSTPLPMRVLILVLSIVFAPG